MTASITLQSISKAFGTVAAIKDVSLRIEPHEFATLVGPSGCGKSTLLNVTAGLERPSAGQILIDGRDVTALEASDRGVAMVFQSYALYPHLSVRRNLGFPLRVQRIAKSEIRRRVADIADMMGITELLDRRPRDLSGGQRQRVAIGRAIIRPSSVCLLDEPLSNLDAGLRVRMRADLKLLFGRIGTTVMLVTHDQAEAMTMSDRIVVLDGGQVQQEGPPLQVYRHPANVFVARFIGSPQMNIMPAAVEQDADGMWVRGHGLRLPLPSSLSRAAADSQDRAIIVGLRPESLSLGRFAADVSVPLQVTLVEHLGHGAVVHYVTETGDGLVGLETHEVEVSPGWRGPVNVDLAGLRLFDANTQKARA